MMYEIQLQNFNAAKREFIAKCDEFQSKVDNDADFISNSLDTDQKLLETYFENVKELAGRLASSSPDEKSLSEVNDSFEVAKEKFENAINHFLLRKQFKTANLDLIQSDIILKRMENNQTQEPSCSRMNGNELSSSQTRDQVYDDDEVFAFSRPQNVSSSSSSSSSRTSVLERSLKHNRDDHIMMVTQSSRQTEKLFVKGYAAGPSITSQSSDQPLISVSSVDEVFSSGFASDDDVENEKRRLSSLTPEEMRRKQFWTNLKRASLFLFQLAHNKLIVVVYFVVLFVLLYYHKDHILHPKHYSGKD